MILRKRLNWLQGLLSIQRELKSSQPAQRLQKILATMDQPTLICLAAGDSLLVGEFARIRIAVTVTPGAFGGPYENSAFGFGTSPGGENRVG